MLKVLATSAAALAFASISFAAEAISSRGIYGNYIEARTADVYTGACVANGEAEQIGKEAVFGWKIDGGSWRGVSLAGLSVVGVIRAEHTLGLHTEPVNPAKAVLILDSRATPTQRVALTGFAKYMAPELLKDVIHVDSAPIELAIKNGNIHTATAKLTAGKLAAIQTRAFQEGDHVCGNEEVWYQPLTKVAHAMPAYALENAYNGSALGGTWNDRLKRSGFVGSFEVSPSE
jgi:hypothetical protein